MNVPTMIVGIRYGMMPEPEGMAKAIKIETTTATIIENNTAMPAVIVVNDERSIERSSLISTIKTTLQIFQAIHR